MNDLLEPDGGGRVIAFARDWRIDRGPFPLRPAAGNGKIFLLDLAPLHRLPETPRSRKIFCHQHEPAGLAIEPVND